ncbi:MAG TPA: hypothetical protein VMV83_09495 [Rectinemataceae bacterium]|nr:hypothetical protein [Rectinemataceae bacterium]
MRKLSDGTLVEAGFGFYKDGITRQYANGRVLLYYKGTQNSRFDIKGKSGQLIIDYYTDMGDGWEKGGPAIKISGGGLKSSDRRKSIINYLILQAYDILLPGLLMPALFDAPLGSDPS